MTAALLEVKNLRTWFDTRGGRVNVVDDISFSIKKGETFALLGESGCGKSMTALSIMRLLPMQAAQNLAGKVLLNGTDLLSLPEAAMRNVRGNRIAMIFQEPMTSLNPVLTVGAQIGEVLTRHKNMRGAAMHARICELLNAVGIPEPRQRSTEYPHQLSGGMKQRVVIAMALAGEPDLLIADEPTTALDVTIQAQVLDLIRGLQKQMGMAVLMISHDLGVVSDMADHVAVMYAGQIVESARREEFFNHTRHPYSKKLFEALPTMAKRDQPLAMIPGTVPLLNQVFSSCRFAPRCQSAWELCHNAVPQWLVQEGDLGVRCHLFDAAVVQSANKNKVNKKVETVARVKSVSASNHSLLEVQDLKVHFPIHKGLLKRVAGYVYAVDGVSLNIRPGKTLALVGESGCGKTTLGKSILQLIRPTAGSVQFEGTELTQLTGEALRQRRRDFQIIFQDPFSSMNPRMMVGDIVEEGMLAQGIGGERASRRERVAQLLAQVGLRPEHINRYPHEFSGGQRQRICVARALAVSPKLIVCDEPTSALDVSVQAQILNLLSELQDQLQLAFLFITHNISVVAYLADEVAVMYLGRIVEQGPVEEVLTTPRHPYTQALLSAVPTIDKISKQEVLRLEGDPPSPINPPSGCHFHPRCPHKRPQCEQEYPAIKTVSAGHTARCYLL